jgi:two-component system, cell cycle response regulator
MRIILVDSSRTVLHLVGDLIAQAGHEVRPFRDGQDALEHLESDLDVRALITSMAPYSLSGMEVCAKARSLAGKRRPLYIFLMSSSDERSNVIRALDNGADDFIHKPPAGDELRARLRAADRLTTMQQELIRFATQDSLTGLLTRRAFFERASEWCERVESEKCAVMLDIDYFKRINDTYGHQAGDAVLRAVAAQVAVVDGIIGRLGGEEFCLLVNGPLSEAVKIAENLRRSIAEVPLHFSGADVRVTGSFGVSEWKSDDTIDSLLVRADTALYQSKHSGRNRVTAADEHLIIPTVDENWHGVARLHARGRIGNQDGP